MKRSEMVEKIHQFINDRVAEPFPTTESDDLLTMLEEKGMLPPKYARSVVEDYEYNFINAWEPEDCICGETNARNCPVHQGSGNE